MKITFDEGMLRFKGKTYEECYKIIFMWVKQDKINPATMEKLMVECYKLFKY